IELRDDASLGAGMIALGHMESVTVKSTGEEDDLPDETGDTQHIVMRNVGEEATVRCRFPSVRPAPRKGWFFQLQVPRAAADADGDPPAATPWNSTSPGNSVFLITDVELMWEEKGSRKYSITGKRWASLGTAGESRIID